MHPALRPVAAILAVAAVAAAAAGAANPTTAAPAQSRPLVTGIVDGGNYPAAQGTSAESARRIAYARMRSAGATTVRLGVSWRAVAPTGARRPAGFDATDPADPNYRWESADVLVKAAVSAGLQPIVTLAEAPVWAAPTPRDRAQDGPTRPDPAAYGEFAAAAAKRYSGKLRGLPRVRYWQAWNEPNVSIYLMPQTEGSRRVSPVWYRRLVNAFADGVHGVDRTNVVIAGGLSPFSVRTAAVQTIGPLQFLRDLLCVSRGPKPRPTCKTKVRFDVLAVHPYTSGGPTRQAFNPNDLSLGDLPELRPMLDAAVAAGHLVAARRPQLWVTEFSWDTNPPDPGGVPVALHARWTAEALYRMWTNGVSQVSWFLLRDQPRKTSDFQSGLYFAGATIERDRPKPALHAFRFPFVAFSRGGGVDAWGRTPGSRTASVRIELSTSGRWRPLGQLRADRNGIFRGRLRSGATTGFVRAVMPNGETSRPFSLRVPPDRKVAPFGLSNG